MAIYQIIQQFFTDIQKTSILEYIAVLAGIVSVWYSSKENVWVYPVGLVNTIIFIYLSYRGGLIGEASVNIYYSIMSIIGWRMWAKKDAHTHTPTLKVSFANAREWLTHILFFLFFFTLLFFILTYLKLNFAKNAIPWADAFASATAFTGMWLMAKKKVESWYWWIATNLASIPLYFVKHYVFTSVYYILLLVMAFWGLALWAKKAKANK